MYKKGFTLIELLIVIGIVAILAAAVIITITPGQRLAEARDATRERHLHALQTSIYVYAVDYGDYPDTITTSTTEICNTNTVDPGDCAGHGLIDLSMLTLPTMPVDPHGGVDPNGIGYFVAKGSIILTAPKAETRTVAIGVPEEEEEEWDMSFEDQDTGSGWEKEFYTNTENAGKSGDLYVFIASYLSGGTEEYHIIVDGVWTQIYEGGNTIEIEKDDTVQFYGYMQNVGASEGIEVTLRDEDGDGDIVDTFIAGDIGVIE
jgi:prepilin-type N-terminal cleavage/methylation domain-containing protein